MSLQRCEFDTDLLHRILLRYPRILLTGLIFFLQSEELALNITFSGNEVDMRNRDEMNVERLIVLSGFVLV